MRTIIPAFFLVACALPTTEVVQELDLDNAWDRVTLYDGYTGADGVALGDFDEDGLQDVIVPWEQSHAVTITVDLVGQPTTFTIGTGLGDVEDAIAADVDGDGCLDGVSASTTGGANGKKVRVHWAPCSSGVPSVSGTWTTMTVEASAGVQKWIQLAWHDGLLWAGGVTAPASVGYFTTTDARSNSAWTYHAIGSVGWTMSLVPMDFDGDSDTDLVYSDRNTAGAGKGSAVLEWTGSAWVRHAVGNPGGDPGFLWVGDLDDDGDPDVVDGKKHATNGNATFRRTNNGSWSFTATQLTEPSDVGDLQAVYVVDLDVDGELDLLRSYSNATGTESGCVWSPGPDWTERGEMCGTQGDKWDNFALYDYDGDQDPDVIQTEQVAQDGAVILVNDQTAGFTTRPWTSPSPADVTGAGPGSVRRWPRTTPRTARAGTARW